MTAIQYAKIRRSVKGKLNVRRAIQARKNSLILQKRNKALREPLFRVCYHEAGHYFVRKKLQPEAILKIQIMKNAQGDWIGECSRLDETVQPDAPMIVGQISIAGAVAETPSAYQAYELLKNHPDLSYGPKSDHTNFQISHGLQRRALEQKGIVKEKDYFDYLYDKVSYINHKMAKVRLYRIAQRVINSTMPRS